jgi:branched-chain amino acid transport system ATP-binding protein
MGAGAVNSSDLRLRVHDLSIEFGGLKALSNFTCEIYHGELVGLIGPNGAGKTTAFNLLSGIYAPSAGEIEYRDRRGSTHLVKGLSPAKLNHLGIARTFQNIRLFSNLSVEDNIRIALHSSRTSNPIHALLRLKRFRSDEKRMRIKAYELLSLFKIEQKKDELAANLPYGEQRKLEIARALASNPCLLLLDEPAAGMNPQETEELMKIISFIKDEFRLAILLIEHDMRLVMGICKRLVVLDYGRIIAAGTPEEIQQNPAVIKAYLGEEAVNGF